MKPISGPTDYHRYPPRKRRPRREAADTSARPNAPRDAARQTARHKAAPRDTETFAPPEELSPRALRRRARRASHAARIEARKQLRAKSPAHASSQQTHEIKVRRPFWKRARKLAFCLLGVLAFEGAAAFVSSPHFAVSGVRIQGDPVVPVETASQVRDSLVGQNWVRARWSQAQKQLKNVPEVRSAYISRVWTWPPQLAITVSARVPFARVGGGNDWYVVDENGVTFRRAADRDKNLYAVTGSEFRPEIGRTFPEKQWHPVVEFARLLARDNKDGGWNLRRVYFDKSGFASLRLSGGDNDETLVQLGEGDWPQKLQSARWALAEFARTGKHAATLNLLSSSVTTWTPRVEKPAADTSARNVANADATDAAAPSSNATEAPSDTARNG